MATPRQGENTPNDRETYEISKEQLPLHCPLPSMSLWNSHPQVFLPLEETGTASCPYCGTKYTLK